MRSVPEKYQSKNSLLRGRVDGLIRKAVLFYLKRVSERNIREGCPQVSVFSFDHISNQIMVDGIYERSYLDCAFDFLKQNSLVWGSAIDAGANIGNHSLYFSAFYKNVFAFEPNPKVFDLLSINTKQCSNVSCFQFGLSDKVQSVNLHLSGPNNLGKSSVTPQNQPSNETISISLRPIDEIAEFEAEKIGLLKIDVENLELSVLNGALNTLKRDRPVIFFEQHAYDFDGGSSECVAFLKAAGYGTFFEVYSSPQGWRCLPKYLRKLFKVFAGLIMGYRFEVRKIERFERRFYSFIIAMAGRN